MRKELVSLAVGTVILIHATPASAQESRSPAQIKGVSFGISFDEASDILTAQDYRVETMPGLVYSNEPVHSYELTITGRKLTQEGGMDVIQVSTAGDPVNSRVAAVQRVRIFPEGARPTWESVIEKMQETYGKPHHKGNGWQDGQNARPFVAYEWNSKGKKRKPGFASVMDTVDKVGGVVNGAETQPYCTLLERPMLARFGKEWTIRHNSGRGMLKLYEPITLNGRYLDRRSGDVRNFVNGPPREVVFASDCRSFIMVRGDTSEAGGLTNSIIQTMVDHREIRSQLRAKKAFETERVINANRAKAARIEVETASKVAPDL